MYGATLSGRPLMYCVVCCCKCCVPAATDFLQRVRGEQFAAFAVGRGLETSSAVKWPCMSRRGILKLINSSPQ